MNIKCAHSPTAAHDGCNSCQRGQAEIAVKTEDHGRPSYDGLSSGSAFRSKP